MLSNLSPLEIVTYRGALALQFVDAVTEQRITDGLRVRAWGFDPADPELARRVDEAEKSPNSSVYGFRSLPGLERYQIGDTVPAGTVSFIVTVEDRFGRFLPQTLRYDLPLAIPATQRISLFSGPNRPIPAGYGAIRGQFLRTTPPSGSPPQLSVVEAAAWARIEATVPDGNGGSNMFPGMVDGRGAALALVPYPMIAASVLLNEAEWTVSVVARHETAALETDYDLLEALLPNLNREQTPPLQATVDGQAPAALFGSVNVVNAAEQIYTVVGPTNQTTLDFTLQYGRPLILRTQNDADVNEPLSELLLESA